MSRKLLLATLLVSVGAVALVFGTGSPAPVYAITVTEFLDSPRPDTTLRISGPLVTGSLCRVTEPCGYYFRIAERYAPSAPPRELEISYPECVVPDTFREVPGVDIEVTVEGRCAACHSSFEATRVMAKCPGKYEMSRYGGVMPAAPIPVCEGSHSRKRP
jgi:cytochrome c-type biogenesis protein CcmE